MRHSRTRPPLLLATKQRKSFDNGYYERIGSKIQPMPNGCWAWPAYRVVWMILRGPIPDGYEIHHLCGNPGCCNPDHLEPIDPAEHREHHDEARRKRRVA